MFLVPARVNSPILTSSTSSTLSLEWKAVNEGPLQKYYDVTWRTTNNQTNGSATTLDTFCTVTNLESNTAYIFTITARNVAGRGKSSITTPFQTGWLLALTC